MCHTLPRIGYKMPYNKVYQTNPNDCKRTQPTQERIPRGVYQERSDQTTTQREC